MRILAYAALAIGAAFVASRFNAAPERRAAPEGRGAPEDTPSPRPTLAAEAEATPPDDYPILRFTITDIYDGERPSPAPPFHERGGGWILFRACAAADACFIAGKTESDGSGLSFRKAFLASDAQSGSRLVGEFARVFRTPNPKVKRATVLPAEPISCADLGSHLSGGDGTGFRDNPSGAWTATKLFFDDDESEVYFNFDLEHRRGEFAEKDDGYRKSLVAWFALHLRDAAPHH